jgi:hypothetical protein
VKEKTRYSSESDSTEPKSAHQSAVASILTISKERLSEFPQILLRRDNHRCVISAHMDMDFWEEAKLSDDIPVGLTETAHIIPYSYAS